MFDAIYALTVSKSHYLRKLSHIHAQWPLRIYWKRDLIMKELLCPLAQWLLRVE